MSDNKQQIAKDLARLEIAETGTRTNVRELINVIAQELHITPQQAAKAVTDVIKEK